ncbi:lytic transglycosylase domain-containing protein [Thiorhodococcus fuscus]|uniref:Lytic transglycosylase domain-containing protein n=1 Tax=Thiorhodococcus fuscus TaxID=527200 RepID=A0ABW4Y5M4_9GAMM
MKTSVTSDFHALPGFGAGPWLGVRRARPLGAFAPSLGFALLFALSSHLAVCKAADVVEQDGGQGEAAVSVVQPDVSAPTTSDATSAQPENPVARELPKPPEGGPVPSRSSIRATMDRYAARYRLDPLLLQALVAVESAYDPHAVSLAGAIGLMQVMSETAGDYGVASPNALFDVETNLDVGIRHLKRLIEKYGSLGHAVMAYNAGEGAMEQGGGVVAFPETQVYTRQVLTRYLRTKGVSLYSKRAETLLGMPLATVFATVGPGAPTRPATIGFAPTGQGIAGDYAWPGPLESSGTKQPSYEMPTRLMSRLNAPNNSLLKSHLEEMAKRRTGLPKQKPQVKSLQAESFFYPPMGR